MLGRVHVGQQSAMSRRQVVTAELTRGQRFAGDERSHAGDRARFVRLGISAIHTPR